MSRVFEWAGHFHPALVHLPIGFLLLAVLFQWMAASEKYSQLYIAARVSYLLGAISAVLSCLTGLSLSSGGDYDAGTLSFHKWSGIGVAVVSITAYLLSKRPASILQKMVSVIVLALIIIAGHLGGTLTHGEGFLTKGFHSADTGHTAKKLPSNIQDAVVYDNIIQPVLDAKCIGCHGANKQKGGLRLDAKEWILKGGKDGLVWTDGNANTSDLYKRVAMDPLEEKHMPPKGKPQLTESEIILLHWWIDSKAAFDKKVKDVPQAAGVTNALRTIQTAITEKRSLIPEKETEKADPVILDSLRKKGIAVSAVAANSNWLQASFIGIPKPGDETVRLLSLISRQLLWLKLAGAQLTPSVWKIVGGCSALTRLGIEHSNISDNTLPLLSSLHQLQYLNLVGTNVSAQGIMQLKDLPLEQLYLGQTHANTSFGELKKIFPKAMIDTGNYRVESLATDTQLLKPKALKK